MRFAEKIVWVCLITISIVFSLGSTIMIVRNHQHLLDTTIKQNIAFHEMSIYSLESKVFQDYYRRDLSDETQIQERVRYYIKQFETSIKSVTYAISNTQDQVIYSYIPQELQTYITKQNDQVYHIVNKSKQFMIMTSQVKIGNTVLYLTGCYDISPCFEEKNRQVITFVMIDITVIGISYFILRFLSRYLTQSIEKLNKTSQRIASGHYGERTQIQTQDEIGELSQSFDEMAHMNEKRIEELKANLEQREEFMGSFSHEVKTPMTAILGFAEMLYTMDCDEETRRKAARYIYKEGKRLENLSYTLMELLSLGDKKIELKTICIDHVIQQLKEYYQNKDNIIFHTHSCQVYSHQELLFTMMRNLIDNALKASLHNEDVIIETLLKDKHLTVMIKDQGIGMSEENIQKITEPFFMIDKSRSRAQGGAGLGLSIVKRICDVHQTQLNVESQLGKGTVISFVLEVQNNEE